MKGFISYAHDDLEMVTRFRVQLAATEHAYQIPCWADESILAGHHWDETIKAAINDAHLFLLLVSDFWLASRYIRDHELPTINTRAKSINGLIVPIILTGCGWEDVLGKLQAVPSEARRLKPIDEWKPQKRGYNQARHDLTVAITKHWNLKPLAGDIHAVLRATEDDAPGPAWVQIGGKLDAVIQATDADLAAASDTVVTQLHAPNRRKAKDFDATTKARLANFANPGWQKLNEAAHDLAVLLDCPTEDLAASVAPLWNASVTLASFLASDKHLREIHSRDPDPLPEDIHREFDSLIASLAPWVRRFPTARELDDANGAFLASAKLLEPSFRFVERAEKAGLITEASAKMMRGQEETVARDGHQGEKAGSYAIRTARNLLAQVGRILADRIDDADAPIAPDDKALVVSALDLLANPDDDTRAIIRSFTPDIAAALEHVIADPDLLSSLRRAAPVRVSRLTRFARWDDPIPGLPDFPPHKMITLGGPGESFTMGAPDGEEGSKDDERPRRRVVVPFFGLAIDVVTFRQWDAARAAGADLLNPNDEGWGRGDRPVINISWNDAQAYCRWLNQRLGLNAGYRLPTEAEWEYACRARTTTPFSFGETISINQVNCNGHRTYGGRRMGAFRRKTVRVGALPANQWGLRQMHGNVWEWVADAYVGSYSDAPLDASQAVSYTIENSRILRGGSWSSRPSFCRAAYRDWNAPELRLNDFGFRIAKTPGLLTEPESSTATSGRTGLVNNGGLAQLADATGWPSSPHGLVGGALWNNGGVPCVVPGGVSDLSPVPLFFDRTTAAHLLEFNGANLPTLHVNLTTGQLWSNGGVVCIALIDT